MGLFGFIEWQLTSKAIGALSSLIAALLSLIEPHRATSSHIKPHQALSSDFRTAQPNTDFFSHLACCLLALPQVDWKLRRPPRRAAEREWRREWPVWHLSAWSECTSRCWLIERVWTGICTWRKLEITSVTGHLNGLSERLGERQIETLSESAKLFSKVLLEFLSSSFQVLFEFFSRILDFFVFSKVWSSSKALSKCSGTLFWGLSFEDFRSRYWSFSKFFQSWAFEFKIKMENET